MVIAPVGKQFEKIKDIEIVVVDQDPFNIVCT
jgi:hypothetical protein